MGRRLDASKAPIQLEKYILRQILGRRPAAQHVQSEAEHHPLMAADKDPEGGRIASASQRNRVIVVYR